MKTPPTTSPSAAGPSPPRQERSRATLDRILAATEGLLEERLFDAISMAEIARRAGVSVGVIYTRFPGKEALLPALFERHDAAVGGRIAGLFTSLAATGGLRQRVELVVDFAVDYHLAHRGLLRALAMHVRAHPDAVPARTLRERAGQYRAVAEALLAESTPAPGSLERAEFVLATVNALCQSELLFGEVSPLRANRETSSQPGGARALREHLVHLVHAALTTP